MTLEPSRGETGDKPGRERVSMSAQTHQDTPVQEHRSAGSTWLVVLAVALAQLLLFWVVSRFRFIDGDEAFYLIAARKVAEGSVVYRDFFYPQMPFLPSVYGTWTRLVGDGWFEGRLLSCIFAALTGTCYSSTCAVRSAASRGPCWAFSCSRVRSSHSPGTPLSKPFHFRPSC